MVDTSCWATFNLLYTFSALLTGLSHSPRPDKAEISFSMSDNTTYSAYVDHMKAFLKAYDKQRQSDETKFEDCGGTTSSKITFKPMYISINPSF